MLSQNSSVGIGYDTGWMIQGPGVSAPGGENCSFSPKCPSLAQKLA